MLVAVPLALFVYLSAQSRYFGRWLLPAYPALAMLGALALTRAAELIAARVQTRRATGAASAAGPPARCWPASPRSCSCSRWQPTSAARRCSAATTPASRRATGSRRTTRRSCDVAVEPAVPGRWFRSNPEGDPPSWLSRCERRDGWTEPGWSYVADRGQRICAQYKPGLVRAARRRRPGVLLPLGARTGA